MLAPVGTSEARVLQHVFPQSRPSLSRSHLSSGRDVDSGHTVLFCCCPLLRPACPSAGPRVHLLRPPALWPPGHAAADQLGVLVWWAAPRLGLPAMAGMASRPVRSALPPPALPVLCQAPGLLSLLSPKITCPTTSFPEESLFRLAARGGHVGQRPLQPQRPDAVGARQQVERARPGWHHRRDAGGDRLGARAR